MSSAQDQPAPGTGTGAAVGTSGNATGAPVATGEPMGKHASPTAEAERGYVPRQASGYDDRPGLAESNASGAVIGWTVFAAVMLMIAGIGNVLEGIAQLVRGSYFTTLPNYAYNLSVHSWGWIHLIAGIVVFLVGAALLADRTWARAVGVAIASLSLFLHLVYLPFFPVWSIVVIALDAFVIWALLSPRRGYA
ncbi:MAG TPA: hypothetical protein VIL16_16420 [Trebonia sp.]